MSCVGNPAFDINCTILAGVPASTLQKWLADAQNGYANLMTGGGIVTVSYDGKSVTYRVADATYLMNWIRMLQRALGLGCPRRALRPIFAH